MKTIKIMAIQYPEGVRTVITNDGRGITPDLIDGEAQVNKLLVEKDGRFKVVNGASEECET